MKTIAKKGKMVTFKVFLLAAIILLSGCNTAQIGSRTAVFRYDPAEVPNAKPWTSENFKNNPEEFQFAIIGDRTGGSDPGGIFNRAMDQLNLLQPEFVINVGDLVEGYTEDKAKAAAQWDEVEGIIKTLEMPFFYVAGNHDLGNDVMKQVWLERRGSFIITCCSWSSIAKILRTLYPKISKKKRQPSKSCSKRIPQLPKRCWQS